MLSESQELEPLLSPEVIDATPVYPIIHLIRSDVMHFIDTPLSYDALTAPDLTYTLIRPLHEKYKRLQQEGNMSVVFCLLLNRVHFNSDQNIATKPVSRTRAEFCELLAARTLRDFGDDRMQLLRALTTSWPVYSGAPQEVLQRACEEGEEVDDRVGNAVELAIVGRAKRFIKSPSCQRIIDAIWTGKCVYQAENSHSIIHDTYKRTPIHFYDPHKAPLLDHYRLKVPAIRAVLEYINFLVLFILFVVALELNEVKRINVAEALFMIFALGFSLEKVAAMQEHGVRVYTKGTWNGFDMAFVSIYIIYAVLRLYGVYYHMKWAQNLGIDFLALIACLLFPRLMFVTLKNNLMVLALRAMMMQFVALMVIAAFCFCGFLYALWTLSKTQAHYSLGTIAWWMLDLWFGLDASGFERAGLFHPIFGPILMVTYACLSNTLLLTVLVSILSNTFATINEDAAAEAMFRKAVSTIEGVKADSLFSYQPPINIVAVAVLLPMSYILTPRWLHKVNVFFIRLTSFPLLLSISLYERFSKKNRTVGFRETVKVAAENIFESLPRQLKKFAILEGLAGSDADIAAIFEIEDELAERDSALQLDDEPESPKTFPIPQPSQRLQSSVQKSTAASRNPSSASIQQQPLPPGPRQRVGSILSRGLQAGEHMFESPLAQIFQPLVVAHSPPGIDAPLSTNNGVVSYGPASRRRRLSSLSSPPGNGNRRVFPSSVGANGAPSSSPEPQHPRTVPEAQEPDQDQDQDQDQEPSETASRIVNDDRESDEMGRRLEAIERCQERIEDMLQQLLARR